MNNLVIKKTLISYLPLTAIILAGASFSSASFADDITHSVRSDSEQVGNTENYFELGLMYVVGSSPSFNGESNWDNFGGIINFSYNWNGLFFENYSESGHGTTFGYSAFNNDNWSLDLIVTTNWLQSDYENTGRYVHTSWLKVTLKTPIAIQVLITRNIVSRYRLVDD